MSQIIKLDQHITNLIAAGEVIERVSSVVKELVENSVDAGASKITISLIDSGITEITVSDNGIGMTPQEAKLSIERHATSKIKTEDDLYKIATLGFRGEALASIVAVSNFRMKTSTDGERGFMFTVRGGEFISEATIAHPKGTEITVRNLFFNTPARLQTLSSPNVELSYTLDYVSKMALGNPHIAFRVINNGKTILQTSGSGYPLETIHEIYGLTVSKAMIPIINNDGFFEISGFVSNLNISRASKNDLNIIVNGRAIRNQKVMNAIINAYKNLLPIGRYPICLLNIKVDYSLVDVNIHPAKLEIRFTEEERLYKLITETITSALDGSRLIVNLDNSQEDNEYDDWFYEESSNEENMGEIVETDEKEEIINIEELLTKVVDENNNDSFLQEEVTIQKFSFVEEDEVVTINETQKLPRMDYIGQLFGTYILAQGDDYFYLIDQHAAMERIMYEKIINEFKKDYKLTYELLIPVNLEFSISEASLINEKLKEIADLGVKIEYFGAGSFILREVPTWVIRGAEKEYVEEMIVNIINNKKLEKYEFLDSLAKKLACKKSIKANEYISSLEVSYLLNDLAKCKQPYTCPHGRPVIVSYSKYEIEKWFKRVM